MKHIARIVRVVMNSGGHALLGELWNPILLSLYPVCISTALYLSLSLSIYIYLSIYIDRCINIYFSLFLAISISLSLTFPLSFSPFHKTLVFLYPHLVTDPYLHLYLFTSLSFSGCGWQWQTVTVPTGSIYMRISSYANSHL